MGTTLSTHYGFAATWDLQQLQDAVVAPPHSNINFATLWPFGFRFDKRFRTCCALCDDVFRDSGTSQDFNVSEDTSVNSPTIYYTSEETATSFNAGNSSSDDKKNTHIPSDWPPPTPSHKILARNQYAVTSLCFSYEEPVAYSAGSNCHPISRFPEVFDEREKWKVAKVEFEATCVVRILHVRLWTDNTRYVSRKYNRFNSEERIQSSVPCSMWSVYLNSNQ